MFLTADKYAGASSNIKRALTQADHDAPQVLKLIEAVQFAKLKVSAPVWRENAWAHVGITSHKIAITVLPSHLSQQSQRFRESWAKYGWRCFCVSKTDVEQSTLDKLAKELLAAIDEVKK